MPRLAPVEGRADAGIIARHARTPRTVGRTDELLVGALHHPAELEGPMHAERITDSICHHAEGPYWSDTWGGLRWVDMLAGTSCTWARRDRSGPAARPCWRTAPVAR